MRYVSYSEVKDLQRCERRWFYKYVLRLESVKEYPEALSYGIYGHRWLAGYYNSLRYGSSYYEAIQEGNKPIIELMNSMTIEPQFAIRLVDLMNKYIEHYREEDSTKYRILAVERVFKAPLPGSEDIGMAGQLDVLKYGISGYYKGEIIIEDHKFTHNFWKPEVVKMASQIPLYKWLINNDPELRDELGDKVVKHGFFNQIRYRKMANHNEFFKRSPVPNNPVRDNNLLAEYTKFANHAAELHSYSKEELEGFVSRTVTDECGSRCDFFSICSKSLDGLDITEDLQIGFRPSSYGYNNG